MKSEYDDAIKSLTSDLDYYEEQIARTKRALEEKLELKNAKRFYIGDKIGKCMLCVTYRKGEKEGSDNVREVTLINMSNFDTGYARHYSAPIPIHKDEKTMKEYVNYLPTLFPQDFGFEAKHSWFSKGR